MRTCGSCQECCTRMAVTALGKPHSTPCPSQCPSGCSVYDSRPDECADFTCLWLADQAGRVFSQQERPDHLGVLFAPLSVHSVGAYECRPGGLARHRARELVKRLDLTVDVTPLPLEVP